MKATLSCWLAELHVWQLSTLYLCLSQEGDTEEGGHGVEPALGVAVAGVADLHVNVFKNAAGIRVLRLALKQMKSLELSKLPTSVGKQRPVGSLQLMFGSSGQGWEK